MRRRSVAASLAMAALTTAAWPGTAWADVIFDQADAEELAGILAEAHEAQRVCYGWVVYVDNQNVQETSVGSNFGAGRSIDEAEGPSDCKAAVEFRASIYWRNESSIDEDTVGYEVVSNRVRPTTSDLDSLGLVSFEGLVGDDVDVDVFKAVSALPLLAADAGVAEPLEATPAPASVAAAANGAPTNSPGSDKLRQYGGAILWGFLLMFGGGMFAASALASSRPAATPPGAAPIFTLPDRVPTKEGRIRFTNPPAAGPTSPPPTTEPRRTPPGGTPATDPDRQTRPEE
ncbi:hypothetical protein [Actinophytocola xanthii]|uniref:Uncharacterized protein n=1 Tax=Actinophytocola xanthii TaxID=1912961 RepID=A0A1Q8CWU8_9PSEU|nr:hypothetical protein [Actinophytocola xanthii]OLF18825.1 hypothetical protein BU204_04835 [Actinophytocola xanthii]